MPELSLEQVKHIAKLARLGLSEAELERSRHDLTAVLEYIAALGEVDTELVEPTSHASGIKSVTRADEPPPRTPEAEAKRAARLLRIAPELERGFIKVKSILRKND